MIVEDEMFVRLELEMTLGQGGHEVVGSVPSFEQALALARSTPIDVAIVDLGLHGGGSGFELIQLLRADYDIPSLVISGYIDPPLADRLMAFKPLGLITKPFEFGSILAALRRPAAG